MGEIMVKQINLMTENSLKWCFRMQCSEALDSLAFLLTNLSHLDRNTSSIVAYPSFLVNHFLIEKFIRYNHFISVFMFF